MSFSGDVRDELCRVSGGGRQALTAELAALLAFCGSREETPECRRLVFLTEHEGASRRLGVLARKLFGLGTECTVSTSAGGRRRQFRTVVCSSAEQEEKLKEAGLPAGFVRGDPAVRDWLGQSLLQKEHCRRAFLRGAFLSSGSMSDPNRSYHFEIVCCDSRQAEQMQALLKSLYVEGHCAHRRQNTIVYVKEGEQISRLLGLMDARMALLEYENIRILREVRGNVNRQVNCETANISKTAAAAAQQIADIRFIQETVGLSELTNGLDEMAAVRLQYPTATLKELGTYLDPPIGKSGVNHRLRKLSEIAETLKGKR